MSLQCFAATEYVDPDGDDAIAWSTEEPPGSDHCAVIDEINGNEANLDTGDYISNGGSPGQKADDNFTMETFDVGTISAITVHVHAINGISAKIATNIYVDGAWQTAKTIFTAPANDWNTATYTGTWDQTDLDDLKVSLTGTVGAGIPIVNAMYVEITADSVPEFFGIHFEWLELSSGLLAVFIVVAFGCIYSSEKKRFNSSNSFANPVFRKAKK